MSHNTAKAAIWIISQKHQNPGHGFAYDATAELARDDLGGDQGVRQRCREMPARALSFLSIRRISGRKLRVRRIFFLQQQDAVEQRLGRRGQPGT